MMQSIYTAGLGLSAQQNRLDAIANNIANVNTTAYKYTALSFKDALYTEMENPAAAGGEGYNLQKGTGVLLASTMLDFSQGTINPTGNRLDFAIDGDGFFRLQGTGGERLYTRNGSFQISVEEDGNFLVSEQGYYVLDENENRISLPAGENGITVSENGTITIEGTEGTASARLGIYSFSNPAGLTAAGRGLYAQSPASGEAESLEDCKVRQSSLEGSNVSLADELTRLVRTQGLYSLSGQALQMADQMEGLAINLR